MKESILKGKCILAVDDEPDILSILEEEIEDECEECRVETATDYEDAKEMLSSWTYDLVILDIMGVRGYELLDVAIARKFPVVILTAHVLTPEALKKSIEMGARTYLPKDKLGEIIPFLEDVLQYEYKITWRRLFKKLGSFFNAKFGPDWQNKEEGFWKELNDKIDIEWTNSVR